MVSARQETSDLAINPAPTALMSFLKAWPFSLGKTVLRFIEFEAFGRVPPVAGRVLDLGCGDGVFSRAVCDSTLLVGVDLNMTRLVHAKSRDVLAVCADAKAVPFPDDFFDAVISNSTFEHLLDPAPVLREAARVLRPGGRLILTVPVRAKLQNLLFSRVQGLDYAELFNERWAHRTMIDPAGWCWMIENLAPPLHVVCWFGFESPVESVLIDLLNSLAISPQPFAAERSEYWDLQIAALAGVLSDLMAVRRHGGVGGHWSEALFECTKTDSAIS